MRFAIADPPPRLIPIARCYSDHQRHFEAENLARRKKMIGLRRTARF
jgi:hypothetical protein